MKERHVRTHCRSIDRLMDTRVGRITAMGGRQDSHDIMYLIYCSKAPSYSCWADVYPRHQRMHAASATVLFITTSASTARINLNKPSTLANLCNIYDKKAAISNCLRIILLDCQTRNAQILYYHAYYTYIHTYIHTYKVNIFTVSFEGISNNISNLIDFTTGNVCNEVKIFITPCLQQFVCGETFEPIG